MLDTSREYTYCADLISPKKLSEMIASCRVSRQRFVSGADCFWFTPRDYTPRTAREDSMHGIDYIF